jgi:hypothetical protein
MMIWASRFAALASGYPIHHLLRFARKWFRYYPSRKNANARKKSGVRGGTPLKNTIGSGIDVYAL